MRHSLAVALLCLATTGVADSFQTIPERSAFVDALQGKRLTRAGITLSVTPDGQIRGRAFGRDVTGGWRWQAGYFCRDLKWGRRDLGYNCQSVQRRGNVLRFTSDRGAGDYADLRIR